MEKLDRNGKNTTYEYDCHGRMISQFTGDSSTYVQITVPNESTDMGYDGNGNLKKIIVETKENGVLKGRVTTQRAYDELNRVKTKTETSVDANNNTIVMGQLAKRAKIEARLDGTVNNIKESMKKAGIDKSVVLSIATKPSQTEKINTWSSCIQDDSIVAFGSVHPENENWKDELLRLKEMGIKGIKLHPDYQKFFVDDKKMYPIYELAVDLGLVILFHAGMDIGLPYPYHATPERLRSVIDAFPEGKFVAAHMGGFSYWDGVEEYLVGTGIYLDTSYSVRVMGEEQVRRIINNHGYRKILFATDSPWGDQSEEVEKIREFSFDPDVEKAILGLNAKELLEI